MKTKEIQKFVKTSLLPYFPGFGLAGRVLFEEPVNDVLRGFFFEDSEFSQNTVYVWAFVQPLYTPKGYFSLSFGKRLHRKNSLIGRREDWDMALLEVTGAELRKAIDSQGLAHISRLSDPCKIAKNLFRVTGLRGDPYAIEAVIYSQIILGDVIKGASRLEGLLRDVQGQEKYEELTVRGHLLLEATKHGVQGTAGILNRWRTQTAKQLKIPISETLYR